MLVKGGEQSTNIDRAKKMIKIAADNGADIILLPEVMDLCWAHPSALTKATSIPEGETYQMLMNAARENGVEKELLPLALERDIGIIAIKITGQNALMGNVTGGDLVRFALSLPISVANIGMDSLGTLESCATIGREPVLSKKEAEKIVVQLAYDPEKTRLPYFHHR